MRVITKVNYESKFKLRKLITKLNFNQFRYFKFNITSFSNSLSQGQYYIVRLKYFDGSMCSLEHILLLIKLFRGRFNVSGTRAGATEEDTGSRRVIATKTRKQGAEMKHGCARHSERVWGWVWVFVRAHKATRTRTEREKLWFRVYTKLQYYARHFISPALFHLGASFR